MTSTWTKRADKAIDTMDFDLKPENTFLNISGKDDFVKCLETKSSELTLCQHNGFSCDPIQVKHGPEEKLQGFLIVNVTQDVPRDVIKNLRGDVTGWNVSCKFSNGFVVVGEATPVKKGNQSEPVFQKVGQVLI